MLNDEQLLARIAAGEDSVTEFKPAGASDRDLRKTLVAFANSVPERGVAVLFIGIGNDKKVLGVENTDKLQKTIRKLCTEDCYPEIVNTARILTLSQKFVVAVMVAHSPKRPHFAGAAYVRVGSESVQATEQIYEALISSRNEKAARILQFLDQEITVYCSARLGVQHFLSQSEPGGPLVTISMRAQDFIARLAGCDAFCVQLRNRHSGADSSFPLSWVTIDWDVANRRLKLHVENPIVELD
jgi:hypothetical protein